VRFCDAIGAPELGVDPRYATNLKRIENRVTLTQVLTPILAHMTKDELLAKMHAVKVPGGPIHDVAEALNSDQAIARGTVVNVERDDVADGHVRLLANPLKFSATPVTYRRAPPRFGQDTDAVLATLRGEKPHRDPT
jgi:formyl-CoA transferase